MRTELKPGTAAYRLGYTADVWFKRRLFQEARQLRGDMTWTWYSDWLEDIG